MAVYDDWNCSVFFFLNDYNFDISFDFVDMIEVNLS